MPRAASAQMRILKLIELILNESSPESPMKASTILRRLEKQGICITRITLKSDMALLREFGFNIRTVSLSAGEHYYLESFAAPLRGGDVSKLVQTAIRTKTQITVCLSDCRGEYRVSPYAVFRSSDGFYAACFSPSHRRVVLLPFAKIVSVQPSGERASPPPPDFSCSYYTGRGFELCQTASETVTLSFTADALGDIRARFGENARISGGASGLIRAEVSTEVTPALFAWIFRLGGHVCIVSPEYVRCEYKSCLRAQLAAY